MERHHKTMSEVKEALSLPKKSKKRRNAWLALVRKEDYDANISALKRNMENISVVRGVDDAAAHDYVPCTHCFGFFKSRHLHRHAQTCFRKGENEK